MITKCFSELLSFYIIFLFFSFFTQKMEEVEVENKAEQLTNKTNELETCKRELEKSNNQFTSEFEKTIF